MFVELNSSAQLRQRVSSILLLNSISESAQFICSNSISESAQLRQRVSSTPSASQLNSAVSQLNSVSESAQFCSESAQLCNVSAKLHQWVLSFLHTYFEKSPVCGSFHFACSMKSSVILYFALCSRTYSVSGIKSLCHSVDSGLCILPLWSGGLEFSQRLPLCVS